MTSKASLFSPRRTIDAIKCLLQIVAQGAKGPRQHGSAGDQHVIRIGRSLNRQDLVGQFPHTPAGAVTRYGIAHLATGGKPDSAFSTSIVCRLALFGLHDKARGYGLVACCRDPKKVTPPLQTRRPSRHKIRLRDACALWRAGERARSGHRPYSCAIEIHDDASGQAGWAGRSASPFSLHLWHYYGVRQSRQPALYRCWA